ncbi:MULTISPECIES: hypothetical protein [Streptomyces]|uniref:Uncharacterized protein n=1 Tax=Streptomyces fradiae ATCC 10745 = DSM 40063 TaxID=1319510 RepID=A0ABQ6XKL6_STRFR|nr:MULTISPECIES: hypothetical protein [Streptomyces]KAF0646317.1 hypothetical protein K701_29260 [Streptomyces fradiae ATCC 10745 = DSM 40063]QEV11505.1 hypothetical protein CP974_05175 [Streptomyces fradiae ATCC 10745 = DSM 40063]UQS28792.1 hypothetical protein J5J01_17310 [Streptomyces fradiae]
MSLPGADELFRTTGGTALQASTPRRQPAGETAKVPGQGGEQDPPPEEHATAAGEARAPRRTRARTAADEAEPGAADAPAPPATAPKAAPRAAAAASGTEPGTAAARRGRRTPSRRPSGRERHDEKITVYVSAEELMDLEHARLVLRGEHGLAVDRGRIVREAVAVVLADLESRGDASILVRRLRGR